MCHEPISVLIYIYIYIYAPSLALVEHSVGSTLTMRELGHWPSIAGMSLQSHCGDEEDGHFELYIKTSRSW